MPSSKTRNAARANAIRLGWIRRVESTRNGRRPLWIDPQFYEPGANMRVSAELLGINERTLQRRRNEMLSANFLVGMGLGFGGGTTSFPIRPALLRDSIQKSAMAIARAAASPAFKRRPERPRPLPKWLRYGTTIEAITAKVEINQKTNCWIYMGVLSSGYGRLGGVSVHRFVYEHYHGTIPAGLVCDHLCRVRSCCNPDHIEPVTQGKNVLRGVSPAAENARKTHCINGHPFSGANLKVRTIKGRRRRSCRHCAQDLKDRERKEGEMSQRITN